jgi:hypothetical protein
MSAATETKTAEFKCSCGRSFAHEISLKRHCWVTGHTAEEGTVAEAPAAVSATPVVEEVAAAAPAPIELPAVADHNAVAEALRILREKQMAQEAFEARQVRDAQVRACIQQAGQIVHEQVQRAAETSRRGAEVVRQSAVLALRMLVMILICCGMLLTGMGVGRLLATPADAAASAPAAQRQLVGFQAQQ